jgi:hypothetical protein
MKKLEANIAASRKRLALLTEKRSDAKAALDAAQMQRLKYLHEGDLADEKLGEKLQNKVDAASSVLAGLDDAIGALQGQIGVAEVDLKAQREQGERDEAAQDINTGVDAAVARVEPALAAVRALVQALSAIDHVSFEIAHVAQYLRGAIGEAELALAIVLPDARQLASMVKAGQVAIPRRSPETVEPVTAPAPEVRRLFAMRSIKFTDDAGKLQVIDQYQDADLPPQIADRALRCGACVSIADDRRKLHRGAHGGRHPSAEHAFDLDAVSDASGVQYEPERASVLAAADFKVVDRGPARTGVISVQRVS